MALMVIFGAGASYDSCGIPRLRPGSTPNDPFRGIRPPLTSQLFDETMFHSQVQAHQNCVALITRLRPIVSDPSRSIEEALEAIAVEATTYPHRARQMFALRQYIQAVIQHCSQQWIVQTAGATNYVALLDRIEAWRHDRGEEVSLVTFNYDTLLDSACKSVLGMRLENIADYISHPHYKLLKVHGSVNWDRMVRNVANSNPIDYLQEMEWTDEYQTNPRVYREYTGVAYVPAIAVPTLTKPGLECPPAHYEELNQAFEKATKLIVIGWRGAERHFLEMWAAHKKRQIEGILMVSGSKAGIATLLSNLEQAWIDFKWGTELPEGFSAFLDTRQLEELLG